jgi:hypothetical protein
VFTETPVYGAGDSTGVAAMEPFPAIAGKSHNGMKSPVLKQIGSITNIATAAFVCVALTFTDRTSQLHPWLLYD